MTVNGVTVGSGGNSSNTVVGNLAFASNTTGATNTAIGHQAMGASETTDNNVAVGVNSLYNNTGNNNVAVGLASLQANTGQANTAIGYLSGSNLTTGSNNTIIGGGAQPSAPDVSNEVTICNDAVTATRLKGKVTLNNQLDINKNRLFFNGDKNQYINPSHGKDGVMIIHGGPNFFIQMDQTKNEFLFVAENGTMKITKGRVDVTGSLYVNGTPKSLDVMVTDLEKEGKLKDKLIEKLSDRLDKLEKKLKKAK